MRLHSLWLRTLHSGLLLGALLAFGLLAHSANAQTFSGNTTDGPTFHRPIEGDPPDVLSGAGTAVHYRTHTFTPTANGTYVFRMTATANDFDTFLALYRNGFTPSNGLQNVVVSNDDNPDSSTSAFTALLDAGVPYTVVATGFGNSDVGAYQITVTPDQAVQAVYQGSTEGKPTFRRPEENGVNAPTTLASADTAVPFMVVRLRVSATAAYTVELLSQTAGYDTFLCLYSPLFNSTAPLTNALRAVDDSPDASRSALENITLNANQDYFLVVTGYNNFDYGDFRLNIYGRNPVTLTDGIQVSGRVTLEERTNQTQTVTFTFRPTTGGIDRVVPVTLAANGAYTVTGITPGTYHVRVQGAHWISTVVLNVDARGNVSNLNLLLRGGDSNGDNSVDALDLADLITAFNTVPGDPLYDPNVDFNGDESADALDLAILINNFNTDGDAFP